MIVDNADRNRARELLADYSLEMTAKDITNLADARHEIQPNTQISVTFLAKEELSARVAAAAAVKKYGFQPVPHISARRLTSDHALKDFLERLSAEVGIERAFIVAGDCSPMGPYSDALAVISSGKLAKFGIKKVGISGYPEGHPEISNEKLWQAMKDKIAVLSDFGHEVEIITQFSFDGDPVLTWLQRLREAGISATVRIGVPGPTSVQSLLRFAARCGVGASTKVMAKYGMSITKLLTTADPELLIQDLGARLKPKIHGDVKLHFYPFGSMTRTASWVHERLPMAADCAD